MPPSMEAIPIHADAEKKETTPLVGVAQAAPSAADDASTRRKEYLKSLEGIILVPPKPFPWWRRLPFLGPDRSCVAVGQPLLPDLLETLREPHHPTSSGSPGRGGLPGRLQRLAP